MFEASSTLRVATTLPEGGDISRLLKSDGPVVTAVLLKAGPDVVVEEIHVDTTPKKQMVQKILGGPFTFLGQYEDEGIMIMCLRDSINVTVPLNHHKLHPPFDNAKVYGDILLLRVASEDETDETDGPVDTLSSKSNDEFFLNYTKDEYTKFAARTDIVAPEPVLNDDGADESHMESDGEGDEEEEVEGESDEDDDDDRCFVEMLMGQVIQRFQQENGRMPDELELQALQAAITEKLG